MDIVHRDGDGFHQHIVVAHIIVLTINLDDGQSYVIVSWGVYGSRSIEAASVAEALAYRDAGVLE